MHDSRLFECWTSLAGKPHKIQVILAVNEHRAAELYAADHCGIGLHGVRVRDWADPRGVTEFSVEVQACAVSCERVEVEG